jgi:predicted regulator of Ras-like GTPase activity (Roadblock/LC7/MglB family)
VGGVNSFLDSVAELRESCPGVQRVLLCSSDGLPIVDTRDDVTNGSTAATAAAVLGLGRHTATMLGQGEFAEAVLRSSDGCLVVYGAGSTHVLAVFCSPAVNITLLDRKCRRLVADLESGSVASAVMPGRLAAAS